VTTPNIIHASTCADPKAQFQGSYALWERGTGTMWRRTYKCPSCGETAQIERFEAAEIEED